MYVLPQIIIFVIPEVIRQWFSVATSSFMKIIAKSPRDKKNPVIYNSPYVIQYIFA